MEVTSTFKASSCMVSRVLVTSQPVVYDSHVSLFTLSLSLPLPRRFFSSSHYTDIFTIQLGTSYNLFHTFAVTLLYFMGCFKWDGSLLLLMHTPDGSD